MIKKLFYIIKQKNISIGKKFSIPVILVVTVLMVLSFLVKYNIDSKYLHNNLHLKAQTLVQLASVSYSNPIWTYNEDGIKSNTESLFKDREVVYVLLDDEFNKEIYKKDRANFYEKSKGLYKVISSILKDKKVIATLEVGFTKEYLQKILFNETISYLIIIFILIIITFFLILLITEFILQPIKKLGIATDKISSGDYGTRIGKISNDELGDLALKFDKMTEKLLDKTQAVNYMAYYDSLTALPNRVMLYDKVKGLLDSNLKEKRFAIIFIDIDNFKLVNDNFGHTYGDKLLISVAKKLADFSQKTGVVASRLGGDEFIVFNPNNSDVHLLEEFTETLFNLLSGCYEIENTSLDVTVSIGVALYPDNGETFEDLMKKADIAMYKVKETGKKNFTFFTNKMSEELYSKMTIAKNLRNAIKNNEFILYFQPQFSLETHSITAFEALIRWISPELGFVNPINFISIAEETGEIIEIGDWVISAAINFIKKLGALGFPDIKVAVNISAHQLLHGSFLDKVIQQMETNSLPKNILEFEITESVLIHSFNEIKYKLGILKNHGINIALDDFGTGYSSLSYLRELPLNNLKIDKSFVDGLNQSSNQKGIISAVTSLAHEIGLDVVAEGVETLEQLQILKEINCDKIQGYYISKPLPEYEALYFLKNSFPK